MSIKRAPKRLGFFRNQLSSSSSFHSCLKMSSYIGVIPVEPTPEYYNLRSFGWSITTQNQAVQSWSNRRLTWSYAFNHGEAGHCFQQAISHGPTCAMSCIQSGWSGAFGAQVPLCWHSSSWKSSAVPPQMQKTLMVSVENPGIIWMLVSTGQGLIETQVFCISLHSLFNMTLFRPNAQCTWGNHHGGSFAGGS